VSLTTIRMAVGRVVLVAGVLVLLFVPYLLWGTGVITAQHQADLRAQFAAEQHRAGIKPDGHVHAPPAGAAAPPQTAPPTPDPPIGNPVGVITIPKISLSMMIVEGTGEAQLQEGPGHYPGTPMPGQPGNAAVAGHRTTYLHPFYSLDALVPGDSITIETLQGIFLYHVLSSQAVDPSDVAVVAPTPTPELTLTTCNPRYSASQRLVVHAALVASLLVHASAPVAPVATTSPHRHAPPAAPAHNWWAAILWGLLVAVLTTAVWVAARRSRAVVRAAVIVGGLAVWLVVVYEFFGAVAPLLPASY
jgi:sortase A